MVIKTLDPDPDSLEILDPDPDLFDPDPKHCSQAFRVHTIERLIKTFHLELHVCSRSNNEAYILFFASRVHCAHYICKYFIAYFTHI